MASSDPPPMMQSPVLRYALYGATFGAFFPVFSTIFDVLVRFDGLSMANVVAAQATSPLHWVIDTAPIFLGLFASFAGRRQQALERALGRLRETNEALAATIADVEKANAALEVTNVQLEQTNTELVRATQLKSQFLANMSHELRTPLNAIIGFSRILIRKTKDLLPDKQAKNLRMVHESGQHLLEMVNDLLDIERIEAGMLRIAKQSTDAGELAAAVVSRLSPAAADKGLTLRAEVDGPVPHIETDGSRLRQVLDNLVNNAIKYSDDGAIVLRVSAGADTGKVQFAVEDQGLGIPEDQLPLIFDAFHQVDGTTTRAQGGVGLGLHLVKRLVDLLDGTIDAASNAGKGSTFTVALPAPDAVAEPVEEEAPPSEIMRPAGEGPVVLVIDDQATAIEIMQTELTDGGFRVHTALSGEEGLRKADQLKPDVIVLDIIMPKMDGWQVLRTLRRTPDLCSTPVLVTSMLDDSPLAYELGIVAWLTKPLAAEDLKQALDRAGVSAKEDVLVVEDDDATRSMVLEHLHDLGAQTRAVADGKAALEALQDRLPKVLILDLMLPEVDGFHVLDGLRQLPDGPLVPVVVYTAKDLSDEERARLDGGLVEVISKGGQDSVQGVVASVRRSLQRTRPEGAQGTK